MSKRGEVWRGGPVLGFSILKLATESLLSMTWEATECFEQWTEVI